jgi:hypothetical protein
LAPQPDRHDVSDLTPNLGQLGQEQQGKEQQGEEQQGEEQQGEEQQGEEQQGEEQQGEEQLGEEQTLSENHAPETRFDPPVSRLELAETSDRRTVPPHQVEGGNDGPSGLSMIMGGGYPTPPPSDDGASNRSAEQSGNITQVCRQISGQKGPWKKEIVRYPQHHNLREHEDEYPLKETPLWAKRCCEWAMFQLRLSPSNTPA